MRRGSTNPTRHDHGQIEVFATGDTIALLPTTWTGDDEPTGSMVPPAAPQTTGDEVVVPFHARRGPRPGGLPPTTSSRRGGDSDIVRPLLVHPAVASALALGGTVFAPPLPHLRMRARSEGDERYLVWSVEIAGVHSRPVPATLHLLASPSLVVTVLELVPACRLRWGRDRFVAFGVEAIDALARRIERAA